MGDDAKINGLVELYKRKFEDIYRLNDLDWRYITALGGLITALAYVGVSSTSDLSEIPFYIVILIFLLSLAGLVSVLTTGKTMHMRLYVIDKIELRLNKIFGGPDVFPRLYKGVPKNLFDFILKIMRSIRGPLVLIYSFVISVCCWLILKSDIISSIMKSPIFFAIIVTLFIICIIFCIQYEQLDELRKKEAKQLDELRKKKRKK